MSLLWLVNRHSSLIREFQPLILVSPFSTITLTRLMCEHRHQGVRIPSPVLITISDMHYIVLGSRHLLRSIYILYVLFLESQASRMHGIQLRRFWQTLVFVTFSANFACDLSGILGLLMVLFRSRSGIRKYIGCSVFPLTC